MRRAPSPPCRTAKGFTELGLTEAHGSIQGVKGRDLAGESMFEYGSRVGFWRLLRLFHEREMPMTVFGCALALERNPEAAAAIRAAGYDVCCHGWRWIKHFDLSPNEEQRAHQEGHRLTAEDRGRTALRLVLPLRPLGEHPPPRRSRGRVPLRQRLLR